MSGRKKVKKKIVKKKVLKPSPIKLEYEALKAQFLLLSSNFSELQNKATTLDLKLGLALECLRHYTKKDQIGELANPAIELMESWGNKHGSGS